MFTRTLMESSDEFNEDPIKTDLPGRVPSKLVNEEIEVKNSDFILMLATVKNRRLVLSETGFQQLLKKAQKSDLMHIFIAWIKENQAMISLDNARTLLDLLIDDGITAFKGIGMIAETSDKKKTRGKWLLTMFEKEKEKLKVLFGQILEVVELYSQKLKLTATAVFPMDYADVNFTVILYEVLKKRPMEVEIELCESLRNILKSSHANGPAVRMLIRASLYVI